MRRLARLLVVPLALLGCSDGGGVMDEDTGVDSGARRDTGQDIPVDRGTDAGTMDVPPMDTGPARCTMSAQCMGNPAGPVCDVNTGACIPCTPMEDRCPAGQYCVPGMNRCEPGCRDDQACASMGDAGVDGGGDGGGGGGERCDRTSRRCVQCVLDPDCPPGSLCVANTCVPGCSSMRPCPSGRICCDRSCVDPETTFMHCGSCGNRCAAARAIPACVAGRCAIEGCTPGYGDCDNSAANGCEVDTQTSMAHCGRCGATCSNGPNATARCSAGRCVLTCATGFADCDNDPSNGCEAALNTSLDHCGQCGRSCRPANAASTCTAGTCNLGACNTGFANCDGSADNGCEANLRSDVGDCGRCGNSCNIANAVAVCQNSACAIGECRPGFTNCDNNLANGCEVETGTSLLHCGACNRPCTFNRGVGLCTDGACSLGMCNPGFGNCDNNTANGCEVDLRTSAQHCGACNRAPTPEVCGNAADENCDGRVNEGCRPSGVTVAPLATLNAAANARGVFDIAFDDAGNAFMVTVVTGVDSWVRVTAAGVVTRFNGEFDVNMGYNAASPDGTLLYGLYTAYPGYNRFAGVNRLQSNAVSRVLTGTNNTPGHTQAGNEFTGAAGIAYSGDGNFYVGNLNESGEISRVIPASTPAALRLAVAPARVVSVDCDRDRSCYFAAGNIVYRMDVRALSPSLTTYFDVGSPVRSIAYDENADTLYYESQGSLWRRPGGGTAVRFVQAVDSAGALEIGPDDALYRVRGVIDGTSVIERYPLPTP